MKLLSMLKTSSDLQDVARPRLKVKVFIAAPNTKAISGRFDSLVFIFVFPSNILAISIKCRTFQSDSFKVTVLYLVCLEMDSCNTRVNSDRTSGSFSCIF